jgi:integrase
MIDNIYKRKPSGIWYRRFQLEESGSTFDHSLKTKNKEVATQKHLALLRQKEREAVGQAVSSKVKQALELPLGKHLENYLFEKGQEWSPMHFQMSSYRLKKLLRDCSWRYINDITAFSFTQWRARQTCCSKTSNEFLSALSAFMKWLIKNDFTEANPIQHVEYLKKAGKTFDRRVFTTEEFYTLLASVQDLSRKMTYITVAYTGFRRAELANIEWCDVHLDTEVPYISARASTTKNKKEAEQNIPEFFVEALRQLRPASAKETDKVFSVPSMLVYKSDLKRAGIPYEDERGNRRDFHALRKMFNTLLQANGTAPRVAQELMRHSDIKLTMGVYTDTRLLPKKQAVDSLPDFLGVHKTAHTKPALPGISGVRESLPEKDGYPSKILVFIGKSPYLGARVPLGEVVPEKGLEPLRYYSADFESAASTNFATPAS